MKGLKTFLFGMAVTGLGIMESAEFTHLVTARPGAFATAVGVLIVSVSAGTPSPVESYWTPIKPFGKTSQPTGSAGLSGRSA